jgi:hypothetical protein
MASSSIVRLGPDNGNLSANLLQNAITSFFRKTDSDDNDSTEFVIRNKYFNANIILKDTEDEEESQKNEMEDGIILVFDALRSNPDRSDEGSGTTFDSLQSAHQKALSNNECGDLLRLCVGVSLSELSPSEIRGKDHEKEYSRRILWCLDNGYEYIEADLSDAGKQKGHDGRDKDGFARIVEAIEGTVWSSASMSTSRSNKLKDSFADTKTKMEKDIAPFAESEETKQNQYEPPNPSLLASPDSETQTMGQIQKENVPGNTDDNGSSKVDNSAAAIFGLKEGVQEMDPEDMDTDKLFFQMESVLKEASQIRKEGKNLSDEERRERAGSAALALVNLMGQFGLDDDEYDYGSDDSGIVDNDF